MGIGDQEQVVGLEIAVHHVAGVRGGQGLGHLAAPVDGVLELERAAAKRLGERLALEVLHDDVGRAVR